MKYNKFYIISFMWFTSAGTLIFSETIDHVSTVPHTSDETEKFYEVSTGYDEKNQIPILDAKDIELDDEYSGFDIYFDRIYKYAKRDLYLAQQHEKLFSPQGYKYNNLINYYKQVVQQRADMAIICRFLGKKLGVMNNIDNINVEIFSPAIQKKLRDVRMEESYIFSQYVQKPLFNKKALSSYTLPYDAQLKVNQLRLLRAQIIQQALT